MRHTLQLTVALCFFSLSAAAWAAAQEVKPASASSTSPASMDEMLQAVRADLQDDRADLMAKNLSLTSDQAAKFWPMFASYQKEQSVIMDAQLKGIQKYIEGYDKLDDATALALVNAHLDNDARMNALRQKWLAEFEKVLGGKLAARAMQIDRRLSLLTQLQFISKIPLIH